MSSEGTFNILGSSALNTADGKNPTSSHTAALKQQAANEATNPNHSEDHRKKCQAAHNALEDRLREEERLARWRRE